MLFAWLVYVLRGKRVQIIPNRPFWVLLRALLSGFAGLFIFLGFANLRLAQMYTLIFTLPLFVTVLSYFLLKEEVGPRRALAVFVGFLGVVIANRPWAGGFNIWMLSGLFGAFLISTSIIITRHNTRYEQSATITFWAFPGMFVVPFIISFFLEAPKVVPQDLWLLVVLAAFLLVIAQIATTYALTHAQASLIAPFQYTQIIWAFIFGALFFDEWFDAPMIVGIVIIISAGIYIIHRERVKKSTIVGPLRR